MFIIVAIWEENSQGSTLAASGAERQKVYPNRPGMGLDLQPWQQLGRPQPFCCFHGWFLKQ